MTMTKIPSRKTWYTYGHGSLIFLFQFARRYRFGSPGPNCDTRKSSVGGWCSFDVLFGSAPIVGMQRPQGLIWLPPC